MTEPIDPSPLPRARWRVVLVRVAPGAKGKMPRPWGKKRDLQQRDLPAVVRVTHDLAQAQRTAERLRADGATVLVVEEPDANVESAYCPAHPSHLAPRRCRKCDTPICRVCELEAEGEPLCAEHRGKAQQHRRNRRLRQLFLLFLLAALVWSVDLARRRDQVAVDPLGTVDVLVVQLVVPGAQDAPLVRQLNSALSLDPGDELVTLRDIKGFYDAERTRYTGIDRPFVNLHLRGPYVVDVKPPELATPDDGPLRIAWRSWKYARYFRELVESQGVDLDDYGARLIVIYGPEQGDLAAHSRGSERGRIAISYVAVDERNPTYAVLTVAHELGHVLGAPDTYDPDDMGAAYPEGFVEPFKEPLYPQEFAEVMAVDKPLTPQLDVEVRSLDEVRVGYLTAASIGWISKDSARWYYRPTEATPADKLRDTTPAAAPLTAPGPEPEQAPESGPDPAATEQESE